MTVARLLSIPLSNRAWIRPLPKLAMLRAPAEPTPPLPEEVPFAPAVPPAVMGVFAEVIPPRPDVPVDPAVFHDVDFRRRVVSAAGRDATAAEAARLLLADLVLLGWIPWREGSGIKLRPPAIRPSPGETPEDFKRRQQRDVLQPIRLRQLSEPSVRTFLRRMETPRWMTGRRVSVLDLVDDGRSLAQALAEVAQLPPSERGEALARIVCPVIEVATADPKDLCPNTGLVRLDIWRYFRHTWSLEYRSTPGRTLFFLIRNAARPMAPVMGIASLANATLQLKIRDNWVGWSASEIARSFGDDPRGVLAALLRTVRRALGEIRKTDLMKQVGPARGEALEQKLEQIAADALERRKDGLEDYRRRKERGEAVPPLKNLPRFGNGEYNWREASEDLLFVGKRARALADLFYAERILSEYETTEPQLADVLRREGSPESARALRALSIAAREIRKVGLASRMLELNVCGAVPPYRDLLVGKLVALAAASADVASAYAARYQDQHSEIASQMAGKAVYRDASPCVITTTSLYAVISSQYNRLKLRLDDGRVVRWQELEHKRAPSEAAEPGEPPKKQQPGQSSDNWTAGKGTGHLSDDTVQALRDLTIARSRLRRVNNVFGEGQSPRLRQVREGLGELRLDPDYFLRHSMPRRVYGLELFPGARRTLCLNLPATAPRIPFDEIAAGWRTRWLEPRIANRDVLARVAESGPETVRAELTAPEGSQRSLFPVVQGRGAAAPSSTRQAPDRIITMAKKSNPNFVQNLYRALNACADHHTAAVFVVDSGGLVTGLGAGTKHDQYRRIGQTYELMARAAVSRPQTKRFHLEALNTAGWA